MPKISIFPGRPKIIFFPQRFEIVLHGTLACRIFFQLREACERQGDSATTVVGSGMHFASDTVPLSTFRTIEV